eukprot:6198305-Pleurochrysis_carterae.AAC.1
MRPATHSSCVDGVSSNGSVPRKVDGILANLPFIHEGLGCEGKGVVRWVVVAFMTGVDETGHVMQRPSISMVTTLDRSQMGERGKPNPEAILALF